VPDGGIDESRKLIFRPSSKQRAKQRRYTNTNFIATQADKLSIASKVRGGVKKFYEQFTAATKLMFL